MPIFDYRCKDCGSTYDVLHKAREVEEDIVCPSCQSKNHQRLLSATNFSMGGSSRSDCPSSGSGCGCTGGTCGLN